MPEKDKNTQEGPDIRSNLIKVNMGGDTMFVDPDQYKPQLDHQRELKRMHRKPKNPKPQEWKTEDYSKHKIADYKPFNFVDGEGVRCSLYVSGCLFDCPGCYNLAAQNFNYGFPYTQELEDRIIKDLGQPYVRKEFGHSKDIWSWSGYTWDELQKETPDKKEMLSKIDILVDGRFMNDLKDLTLQFRGSSNQRIIDVPKSMKAGKVVIWDKLQKIR